MVRHSVFAQHSILIAILVARNVQKANLGGGLLDNMNLAFCCEINERLYLEVMDTLSELSDISVTDFRWAYNLVTGTVKLVSARRAEKKERTTELYDRKEEEELRLSCKTLADITKAVSEDRVTSMFVVIELLLFVYLDYTPTSEELQIFITTVRKFNSDKKLLKVSQASQGFTSSQAS